MAEEGERVVPRKSLFDPEQHFLRHLRQGFTALNQTLEEEAAAEEEEQRSGDDDGAEESDSNPENQENEEEATASTAAETDDDDDTAATAQEDKDFTPVLSFLSHIPINVIDPTSSAGPTDQKAPLNLFEKIQTVLRRDYQSTLKDIPYQHFRSGAKGTIPSLPVNLECTPLVALAPTTIDDPANVTSWHEHYGTHVYICACGTVEEYRNRVKPAIQAFNSQLDALANERSAKSKAPFLIIFCPTSVQQNNNSSQTVGGVNASSASTTPTDAPASEAPRSRVASFASRMVAARQRMSAVTSTSSSIAETNSATTTEDANGEANNTNNTTNSNSEPEASAGLTKVDREILRRLTADFVSGRVCAVPNLARGAASISESTKLEYETLWIELGATLMDALSERCSLYDDKLKKLATSRAAKNLTPVSAAALDKELLLAKESFAFLYQLYRQPAEALMQYEEMRALLPDEKEPKTPIGDTNNTLLQKALSQTQEFRDCIRQADDLASIAYELEHYLLVRETVQLFGMRNAAGVVARCKSFCWMLYQLQQARAAASPEGLKQLHTWAFEFCWDVQIAASACGDSTKDPELARAVCDLLTFARVCLLKLGKAALPEYNGTHLGDSELPAEFKSEWEPWTPPKDTVSTVGQGSNVLPTDDLVKQSLSTIEGFEMLYMEITKVLATYHEACNRSRHAACLRHEVIEIAARRNNLPSAASELGEIARVYERDGWDSCNFFLLFRLAKLQRQFESVTKYLETLVRCFSSPCAPPKAMETLFDDLVAVIAFLAPQNHRMSAAPIFRPILSLENFEMTKVSGTDRNLLKKVYSIGDTVVINFSITSHLPKDIVLDEISVALVRFQTYVSAMEDSLELKEGDLFKTLRLKNLSLNPGSNNFVYNWIPQTSGQFILSSVSIDWQKTLISYTAKQMKRPTIRIDVIPCEPSQFIEIKPDYIVPGHRQDMDIVFQSSKDSVDGGIIQLVGSPGLVVCGLSDSSGDSPNWQSQMEMTLPKCTPGESVTLPILVKSTIDKDIGAVATLHAHVSTLFRRENEPSKLDAVDESDGAKLECNLDKKISTLGKRAFSLSIPDLIAYTADKLLINVGIRCNAPKSFLLQRWSVELPDFLKLADNGDMNSSLENSEILSGERLSFTFDCIVLKEMPASAEGKLILVFDNGEGTTFTDAYNLRLRRPEEQPFPKADMENISVTVSPSKMEGMVGQPIDVTCSIDTSSDFLGGKEIYYTVSCKVSDWVVNGKTEGLLDGEVPNNTLEFVGIPMRPGPIHEYMSLSLVTKDETGEFSELPIRLEHEGPFVSKDPPNHPTVAFPRISVT